MSRKIGDISKQIFGRLTAENFDHRDESGSAYWSFSCVCGGTKIIRAADVTRNVRPTKSCGCLSGGQHPRELSGKRQLYRIYKNGASLRNIEFSLEFEQFDELTGQNCTYCGIEPRQIWPPPCMPQKIPCVYNGIDRVNNSKGYTSDNVCPCCSICNKAKRAMSVEDFKAWGHRFARFQLNQ